MSCLVRHNPGWVLGPSERWSSGDLMIDCRGQMAKKTAGPQFTWVSVGKTCLFCSVSKQSSGMGIFCGNKWVTAMWKQSTCWRNEIGNFTPTKRAELKFPLLQVTSARPDNPFTLPILSIPEHDPLKCIYTLLAITAFWALAELLIQYKPLQTLSFNDSSNSLRPYEKCGEKKKEEKKAGTYSVTPALQLPTPAPGPI